jgi:CheY-like chemotaxis protein
VADTGSGIAPEALSRIFDLFAQGPQPLDRQAGGLGLGLTLVRRLAELHGGTATVTSRGPGLGTTATVLLPLAPPGSGVPGPDPAPPPVVARRVLIVEDNADAREMLGQLLAMDGHRVEQAQDGRQAIELALQSRPDVVFVDIGLPGMSGYDLARALRASPVGREVRLVALTGYGQPADRAQAREAGFDAHLVKPVDPEELARVLTRPGPGSRDA